MSMEFWGVEVKAGELFVVESGVEFLLHISQASLGEAKKDKANESVYLYLHINGKKLVLGTLSSDKFPQISLDLVFDWDFELSHNWKNGSVYFTGYKVPNDGAGGSSDAEFDNEVVPAAVNHGKRKSQDVPVKPGSSEGKKVKIVEPIKDVEHDEEDDDSSDEEDGASSDDDSSDDQDMMANGGDQDDDESNEDEESDDEDDEGKEMQKMLNLKKKRAAKSSVKTPVSNKSTKLVTPQKTEGKTSGGHVATPYPSKHASKAPATSDQKKEQTAKPFTCKSCSRSFGSEIALLSHTKAKHSS